MVLPWVNCTDEFEELLDSRWKTTFSVLMTIVSILALLENGIILLVFYRNPVIRTASNMILLSMAAADFLTGLVVAPIYVVLLLDDSLVGNCKFYVIQKYFATAFMGASALIVAFISFDRFQNMTNLQNYRMSNFVLYRSLFICWSLPILVPIFGLINERVYSMILFIVGMLVIFIIIISYVALLVAIRKHRLTLNEDMSAILLTNEKKAWKTVLIIITCYFLMVCPLLVEKLMYAAEYFSDRNKIERPKFVILSKFLCAGNSVVNPLIYGCRTPNIKYRVLMLFGIQVSENRN